MQKVSRKEQFAQKFEQSEANYSENNQQPQEGAAEGKPVQLLRILPSGRIQINEEAVAIIASIEEPVGFVSLVGKTRTGKSCLLNKLLHIAGNGFRVDPSTSSCTDGIWMWSQPYFNQQFKNYVFFLDTQGTDSLVKDAANDTKIFTIALLLSTYFIYNSVGSINEVALSELEMVTTLSKYIKTGSEGGAVDSDQIHRFMPKFMWLLRDFTLKPEDDRGRRISPSQYLENCLNDRRAGQDSRKIKKSIMSYFPNRECLTLVQPVDDEQELQKLNELPQHCLRRQFTEGVNTLRNKIMINTGPKLYESKPITGYSISVMVHSYVDAFNSGKVPNIKTAWEQIAEDEGATAYNLALQKFEDIFNEQFEDNQPKGEEKIYKTVFRLKEETSRTYQQHTYNNKNEAYAKKLKSFLEGKEKEIIEQNSQANKLRNYQILHKHAQKLRSRIESNYYMTTKTAKEEIDKDIEQVGIKYKNEARGQNKGEILTEFINVLTPLILNMKADKSEEYEKLKQAEIAMREQEQKIKQLQQQKASKDNQLAAQQNAKNFKVNAANKKDSRKEKTEKDQGCCAGGKCEIM